MNVSCRLAFLIVFISSFLCFPPFAQAQSSEDLLRALGHTYKYFPHSENKKEFDHAQSLLKIIKDAKSDEYPPLFYYEGLAYYAIGDIQAATKYVTLSKDKGGEATRLESILLSNWIEKSKAQNQAVGQNPLQDANKKYYKALDEYLGMIVQYYPHGRAAFSQIQFQKDYNLAVQEKNNTLTSTRHITFVPKCDYELAVRCAANYRSMGYFEQSFILLNRAAGFIGEDNWISPQAQNIWFEFGDTNKALGKWDNAYEYYVKSIASGRRVKECIPAIKEVVAARNASKTATKVNQEGTPKLLESIARDCISTELFDEANSALDEAEKISKVRDRELDILMHVEKARVIKALLNDGFDGFTYRGVRISQIELNAEVTTIRQLRDEKK
jgi:hypothetical protein